MTMTTEHAPGTSPAITLLTGDDLRALRLEHASRTRPGYNPAAVDMLLSRLAQELDWRDQRVHELEGLHLPDVETTAILQSVPASADDMEHVAVSQRAVKLLTAAQQAADRILEDARNEGHRILEDAKRGGDEHLAGARWYAQQLGDAAASSARKVVVEAWTHAERSLAHAAGIVAAAEEKYISAPAGSPQEAAWLTIGHDALTEALSRMEQLIPAFRFEAAAMADVDELPAVAAGELPASDGDAPADEREAEQE